MTYYYPAVISKKDSGYRVDFPDLEGCFGEGRDRDDALSSAREAGVNWILVELEEVSDLPAQTHLEDIPLTENQESTMVALIMPREGWDE